MAWTTPILVEICIGLEINGYLPAELMIQSQIWLGRSVIAARPLFCSLPAGAAGTC